MLLLARLVQVGYMMSLDTYDPSRSSANGLSTLTRDPAFPLTGFWKSNCSEKFGLVVEPLGEGNTYAVSF